jgi:hypothetical protein
MPTHYSFTSYNNLAIIVFILFAFSICIGMLIAAKKIASGHKQKKRTDEQSFLLAEFRSLSQ